MEDLQSLADIRDVPIERVGITKLALPVRIREKDGGLQHVLAEASLFVDVPATARGTHLSRFVEVLHEWADQPVSSRDIESLLQSTRDRAGSISAEAALRFRYFIGKAAPVSGRIGVVDYTCVFRGHIAEDRFQFALGVGVPVTTLCPCSKAISDYGAHNQRTMVDVEIESPTRTIVWIEDVVRLVEEQASCPVYSVLKREDEKWATERAYDNPKFVEDLVRDVFLSFSEQPGVERVKVTSESIESIHNHNAYAMTEMVVRRESATLQEPSEVPSLAIVE